MIITKFYNLITNELLAILQNNTSDERMKQHKDIAQNKRTHYLNLIKYIRKLMKLNKGDKTEIENIKKEMEEDRKIGIASEKWILEKLAEME